MYAVVDCGHTDQTVVGFFCLFGGPISNRIGLNWTLLLGAVGYPVYSHVFLNSATFLITDIYVVLDFIATTAM